MYQFDLQFVHGFLFPDWPEGRPRRKVPVPAFVLSRQSQVSVMAIRQYLKQDLKHPEDLWLCKDDLKVSQEIKTGRNGKVLYHELTGPDIQSLQEIREEEERIELTAKLVESILKLKKKLDQAERLVKSYHREKPEKIREKLAELIG